MSKIYHLLTSDLSVSVIPVLIAVFLPILLKNNNKSRASNNFRRLQMSYFAKRSLLTIITRTLTATTFFLISYLLVMPKSFIYVFGTLIIVLNILGHILEEINYKDNKDSIIRQMYKTRILRILIKIYTILFLVYIGVKNPITLIKSNFGNFTLLLGVLIFNFYLYYIDLQRFNEYNVIICLIDGTSLEGYDLFDSDKDYSLYVKISGNSSIKFIPKDKVKMIEFIPNVK